MTVLIDHTPEALDPTLVNRPGRDGVSWGTVRETDGNGVWGVGDGGGVQGGYEECGKGWWW